MLVEGVYLKTVIEIAIFVCAEKLLKNLTLTITQGRYCSYFRALRSATIFLCLLIEATRSGVWPCLSRLLGLTSALASSSFTTASCPREAASDGHDQIMIDQ